MIAQRIWALIKQSEVKNTIVCDDYHTANMLAKDTLGKESFAVEITQIPTGIGDTYEEGTFKGSDGSEIETLPTQEEEVKILRSENEYLKTSQAEQDDIIMDLVMGGMQ